MTPHRFDIRIYYEDTDAGGIVYYANYLKFCERARTEWLRELGVDATAMRADYGVMYVVAGLTAKYRRPARLDDLLTVETAVEAVTSARLTLRQDAFRGDETLFTASVDLAMVSCDTGRPHRTPDALSSIFAAAP